MRARLERFDFGWRAYIRAGCAFRDASDQPAQHFARAKFDEIYDAAIVRPMDGIADIGLRDIEKPVLDGAVVGTGQAAVAGAAGLSLTQSGYFRNYVLVFVGGAVVAAVLLLIRAGS